MAILVCTCGETTRLPRDSAPSYVDPQTLIAHHFDGHPCHSNDVMNADETLVHILAEHRMGATGCDVPNDPELSDVWDEIQADPIAWHNEDHETHGVPFDADHSAIPWGA